MTLKVLDHFLVYASDLEATKAFYCDVLGLNVGERPPFTFPGYWLYIDGKAVVHLAGPDGSGEFKKYLGNRDQANGSGTGPLDHIAFQCADFEAFRTQLEERGVEYKHRVVPGFQLDQIFVTDPDGVTIELNFPQA